MRMCISTDGLGAALKDIPWYVCRYELSKVMRELKALKADIIALQEVDIACERSNYIDTGISTLPLCNLQVIQGRPQFFLMSQNMLLSAGGHCERSACLVPYLSRISMQGKQLQKRSACITPSSANLRRYTRRSERRGPRHEALQFTETLSVC